MLIRLVAALVAAVAALVSRACCKDDCGALQICMSMSICMSMGAYSMSGRCEQC
jgi:hypothetical protein